MSYERDHAKLDRVRALMVEEEVDALVVRAPDNVLYLTNLKTEQEVARMRVANEIAAQAMHPRLEDNFLVTAGGLEKLSTFPDGIARS